MDAGAPLSSTESAAAARMISRRRPLHTCGVSLLAIADRAFKKSQDLDGPMGSTTKRMAALTKLASPLVYAMQHLSLAGLSFLDSHILAVENIIEKLFPPSAHVFNKIDKLVQTVEILPGKLDECLKILMSSLTYFGPDNTKEKEIMIDINYSELNTEPASVGQAPDSVESPVQVKSEDMEAFTFKSDAPQAETETVGMIPELAPIKCSYKEALEKGTKENTEKKEDVTMEEVTEKNVEVTENEDVTMEEVTEKNVEVTEKKAEVTEKKLEVTEKKAEVTEKNAEVTEEKGKKDANNSDEDLMDPILQLAEVTEEKGKKDANNSDEDLMDPILQLFESSWHMTPRKGL